MYEGLISMVFIARTHLVDHSSSLCRTWVAETEPEVGTVAVIATQNIYRISISAPDSAESAKLSVPGPPAGYH